jgi:hypothetical protein
MIYKANKQGTEAANALSKAINDPEGFKDKRLAQSALKELSR